MRLLITMLFLMPLCAQPPQGGPPPGGGGRGMMPEPKNLKILKPDQVMPAMRSYTAALGIRCDYCHIQGDFSSDENRKKVVARDMIAMTQQINTHFRGNERVTCYTCHRGEQEPKSAPAGVAPNAGPPPGR